MAKHKHCELIHAYAEGAEIQYRNEGGAWFDLQDPSFDLPGEYRIKPRTVKRDGWVNINRATFDDELMPDRYVGAPIFRSKQDAEFSRTTGYVTTIRIEWEETE